MELPATLPEDSRRWTVSLVVDEAVAVAKVAKDLGIAKSGLRRWVACHLVEAAGSRE
jgi:transposase-like protein